MGYRGNPIVEDVIKKGNSGGNQRELLGLILS